MTVSSQAFAAQPPDGRACDPEDLCQWAICLCEPVSTTTHAAPDEHEMHEGYTAHVNHDQPDGAAYRIASPKYGSERVVAPPDDLLTCWPST